MSRCRLQPQPAADRMSGMPHAELEITQDLAKALHALGGEAPTTPEPVVIVAAYLDALAKSYGLSESDVEDNLLERTDLPPRGVAVIRYYLGEGQKAIDGDLLRDRLYEVFLALAQDGSTGKKIHQLRALNDQGVLRLAQIYWNLEGGVDRPKLPIRPSAGGAAIPVAETSKDFAAMLWTARVNQKAPLKSSGQGFRTQGARLAVLAASHIVDASEGPTPSLDGIELRRTAGPGGRPAAIVWETAARPSAEPSSADGLGATTPSAITSRARAQYAIDSFEQDLRQFIDEFPLGLLAPDEVFGPDLERLQQRQASTDMAETDTLTTYLLPQEAYAVLSRHAHTLPADLADTLRHNIVALDGFLPVRNRVMHGRPLQPDDLEDTETFLGRFRSAHFRQCALALELLASDTGWQPRPRQGSEAPDRVLNNLPEADFNETGLLGRDLQVNDVVAKVKKRREPITLIGEGGIGKTALALEVCYRLVDDPEPAFEAILWTSLKSEQLTAAGIRELSNALRDIDGVTQALGQAIDGGFHGDAADLSRLLSDRPTLVVIDNLETVQGDEVVNLYDALPGTVTFLFTSRVGVGQLERPVHVGPLDEASAELLFRKFARSSGVSDLAQLPPDSVGDLLRELRYSPLAIRWYILSVEAGRAPSDILRNQDELLQYCVANVVEALGADEKLLLDVLRVLDRPVSFDELAVISEMEIDTLRRGAQRLTQRSLLVRTHLSAQDEAERLSLSSTARAFLPTVPESETMDDVLRREAAYKKDRETERRAIEQHGRYFDPNIIFERTPSDEPLAHLLKRALHENKTGNVEGSVATMARARALNPGYFEVDRVDAYLASIRKETARATTFYRSAVHNCRTDEERCWVNYFYSAHLARDAADIPSAIELAEEVHACFGSYDTAHHLGNFYFWDGRFEDGMRLLEWSIDHAPTVEFKRKATTSLVECCRQRGEAVLGEGQAVDALEHALQGLSIALTLHDSGSTDERLRRSIVRAATSAVKAVARTETLSGGQAQAVSRAIERLISDGAFHVTDAWRYLEYAVSTLPDEMRSRLAPGIAPVTSAAAPKRRLRGAVLNVGPKYGFIAHPDFPRNVFFQAGWLVPPTRIDQIQVGAVVEFTPDKNDRGQDQAIDVMPCADAPSDR